MAHLTTIVRVKADTEEEAISLVGDLLTCDGEYNTPSPFDWVDGDGIKISEEVKSEADFKKLREQELKEYEYSLAKANELPTDDLMKGFYLVRAGEALLADRFWCTERLAYELDWSDGKNTYYVETDRHY